MFTALLVIPAAPSQTNEISLTRKDAQEDRDDSEWDCRGLLGREKDIRVGLRSGHRQLNARAPANAALRSRIPCAETGTPPDYR